MRKSLILLGAIVSIFALTSCNDSNCNDSKESKVESNIESKIAIGQKYYGNACLAEMKGYDVDNGKYTEDSIIFNSDNTGKITYQVYFDVPNDEVDPFVDDYYIDFDWDYLKDGSILAYYTWQDVHYSVNHNTERLEEGKIVYCVFSGNEKVIFVSEGTGLTYYSESIIA